MRLVLFDVDGTLVSAAGAGRRALERALHETFGTAGPIDRYDFRGSTDAQIVRDLLLSRPRIVRNPVGDCFWSKHDNEIAFYWG